jgi:hypothetical protein
MTKYQFKFIFAVFLFTLIGSIFWFLPQDYSFANSANNASMVNKAEQKIDFTLKIDFGDGVISDFDAVTYGSEALFQALERKLLEENIGFNHKSFAGLGEFVTQIGSMKGGDGGKNWRYYVNGVMPQVGVSFYRIKNGDIIEWKFEK